MRLVLVRHGETEDNVKDILRGHGHGKLTDLGKEQAKKLGERLSKEKIDVIYCSDIGRAKETAKEIICYHPDIPIHYTKDLRERHVGNLEDIHVENWDTIKLDDEYMKSVDAEIPQDVFDRVKVFLDSVYDKHMNETVLFVAHGFLNRVLICIITNKTASSVYETETQKNTAVNIFEIDEDRNHKIHLLNCVKHLE
ncbi:MAG: histidine phosphatase family protein [Candidatus Aenigmatarchaeota archaeon]